MVIRMLVPADASPWNSPTSLLQMCTTLYRRADSPLLISTTAVMLCGHADAYSTSVRGRQSISVCVCCQAIAGLYVAASSRVDMFVFLPSLFLDFCMYTDGLGYE